MLMEWLFPQLQVDSDDFILQQDGDLPHFHREVQRFLSEHLPRRWIGRCVQNTDLPLEDWPPRSPDITPCDFFLWGYAKDLVFLPPLPCNLKEMKERFMAAMLTVDSDTLQRVWDGLD
jgi:hypothetical protein